MGRLNKIWRLSRWLSVIIGAAALVALIRCFAFSSYIIPTGGIEPSLYNGDRIIVNKWSYGLRSPLLSLLPYHRWHTRRVDRGDVIVFNNPLSGTAAIDRREVFIGRCIARPGDTVMVDSAFVPMNMSRDRLTHDEHKIHKLVVPGKGINVEVTEWNRTLLMNTLILHEGREAHIKDDILYVEGRATRSCHFTKDYYWITSDHLRNTCDSRLFGFLPHDHVIGRAELVWYSKDPRQGAFSGYRFERFLQKVN